MTKHTHTHARKLTQELLTRKLTHTHAHTHAHTHTRAHIHIYAHTQVLPTNTHPGVPFSKVMWWMTEVVMPSLAIVSNTRLEACRRCEPSLTFKRMTSTGNCGEWVTTVCVHICVCVCATMCACMLARLRHAGVVSPL